VEVGRIVVVAVAVAVAVGGRGVTVLVAVIVGMGGAAWAVRVAATRVATSTSRVDVAAWVGAWVGSSVFVGAGDPLQLASRNVRIRKKQIRSFMIGSIFRTITLV
jgi:hypothetical protein